MDVVTPHLPTSTTTLPHHHHHASTSPPSSPHHISGGNVDVEGNVDDVDAPAARPRVRMYVDLQLASPQSPATTSAKPHADAAEGDGSMVPHASQPPPGPSSVSFGQPHQGKGATRVYLGSEERVSPPATVSSPAGVTVSLAKGGGDPHTAPCVRLLEELLDPGGGAGADWEDDGRTGEDVGSSEGLPGDSLHLSHIHCTFLDDLLDGINRNAATQPQNTSPQDTQPRPQQDKNSQDTQVPPQQETSNQDTQTKATTSAGPEGSKGIVGEEPLPLNPTGASQATPSHPQMEGGQGGGGKGCSRGQGGEGEGNSSSSNPHSAQQVQEFRKPHHPQHWQDTLSSQPDQDEQQPVSSPTLHNQESKQHIRDSVSHRQDSKLLSRDSNLQRHDSTPSASGHSLHTQDPLSEVAHEVDSPNVADQAVQVQESIAKEGNWSQSGERGESEDPGATEGAADGGEARYSPPQSPQEPHPDARPPPVIPSQAQHTPPKPSPARQSPSKPSADQNSPAESSLAQHSPSEPSPDSSPAHHSPSENPLAVPSPPEHSPANHSSPKPPSAQDSPPEPSSVQHSPPEPHPAQDSPPEPPPAQESPPDPPPTSHSPLESSSTHRDAPTRPEAGETMRGNAEGGVGGAGEAGIHPAKSEDNDYEDDDDRRTGLAAAVSRVVRRSMRRMRRLRLSGRGQAPAAGSGGEVSEETQVRRGLPPAPPLGLSTVRSPAAASIIVSSLMAALAPPPHPPPRETLTPLHIDDDASGMGDSRSRRRRGSRPPSLDTLTPPTPSAPPDSLTPTPPMSLEVEVGGYLPSAPSNVDETGGSPSNWGATFIPRPSFSPPQSHSSPAHAHSSPSHAHSSPSHAHSSPAHAHSSPAHAHSSPSHAHSSPAHAHSSPAHAHSSPAHAHSSPAHAHSSPAHAHSSPSHALSNPSHSHSNSSHSTSTSHAQNAPSSNPSHSRSNSSHTNHAFTSSPSHASHPTTTPLNPSQSHSRSPSHGQNVPPSSHSSNPSHSTITASSSSSSNPSHSLPRERERGREGGTREIGGGREGEGGEGGGARERRHRNRSRNENSTARNSSNTTDSTNSIISREDSTSSIATATTTLNDDRNSTEREINNNNSRSNSRSNSRRPSQSNSRRNSQSNSRRNSQSGTNSNSNSTRRRRRSRSGSARNSPRPHVGVAGSGRVGAWTHPHSGLMASLAVTLTTFNISRFAVLGARFGWPFVVQWCVVSAVLGLPLMTFHVTLGQYLGAGVVDMWVLSPVFQGAGYSILLAQALLGLYCCVPIAWLFIFFRDSFITHNNMFRWTDCRLMNCSIYNNFTTVIIEGVPKYFNTQVLQRGEGAGNESLLQELGTLKFDMAFNIALIWIITLLALSRGNQWYGKVSYVAALVPLLCYLVVCLYLAAGTKDDLYINDVTNFSEFFMNSRSWMAASREVFLVWGLHSAVLQQMAAHNKRGHALYRDTTVLWVVTSLALVLAAVTGSSCVAGLSHHDLRYKPSSFETSETAQFLTEARDDENGVLEAFMKRLQLGHLRPRFDEYLHHDNFYAGIRIRPSPIATRLKQVEGEEEESGYQSLRLATELFPALLAVSGAKEVSPFWSSLFYLSLLLFGIAQQLAVWRTVVEAVISLRRERLQGWETFITFLCCLFGFSAALPMATGAGIHILYFLDYAVSCGWWLMIIQLVQIFALLFVRGKPYSGQDIVSELLGREGGCGWLWLGPLTSFSWNIIVPVGLLVLSISSFKSGQYREVFTWGGEGGYWPVWACQLAAALQLFPILLVPLVGLAQTCRYLASSDDDLFERIQRLYRPTLRSPYSLGRHAFLSTSESDLVERGGGGDGGEDSGDNHLPLPYSDPPPKYTPPPSYSTATGARLAKLLNQGVRQSIRRLRASFRSATTATTTAATDSEVTQQGGDQSGGAGSRPYIPPPDYVTATDSSSSDPPQYATLDPLRRQRALAVLSGIKVGDQGSSESPGGPASSGLNRNSSLRGSGFGRSLTSGVRRSARRLAATLGVGGGEDGAALVVSEATPSQASNSGTNQDSQPYVYTNIELVSHSYA